MTFIFAFFWGKITLLRSRINQVLTELVLVYFVLLIIILSSEPISKWDYSQALAVFVVFKRRMVTLRRYLSAFVVVFNTLATD